MQTNGRSEGKRRDPVHIEAILRLSNGKSIPAVITRWSSDGSSCKISIPEILSVGEALELAVPGRAASLAYVSWSRGDKAGLLFVGSAGLEHP
jgi:hypothetical protein